jgi:ATP-dependent DNA helicase RecG
MFADNEPLPFEEKTVRNFSFDDISKVKVNAFVKEADIRIDKTAIPEFLRSLRVADAEGVKNVGILFFAKDVYGRLRQAQMTLLAFKGTDRTHIYDRNDVRDDLLTQFNEAIIFLKKHLNIRSVIRGVNREDIYEIPLEVLREAVVNALMHRDYSIIGTQISVEVYDDRVEIINPGGLPKGLSMKNLGKVSVRRNELIADLFFRLHKVERIGMGIQKMKDVMAAVGLRPPVFIPNGFFRAIFYRLPEFALKESHAATDATGKRHAGWIHRETTQEATQETTQEKILELIKKNPSSTRKELADKVGLTTDGVKYHLDKLKKQGIIKHTGATKKGKWEVME